MNQTLFWIAILFWVPYIVRGLINRYFLEKKINLIYAKNKDLEEIQRTYVERMGRIMEDGERLEKDY